MQTLEDTALDFNDFIRERRHLKNVSPATPSWYTYALKWLPNESPSQTELTDAVLRISEKDRRHGPDFSPTIKSQWKNFFRAAPIMPTNPVPSRSRVPDSGTGVVEKIALRKTYWPSKGLKIACTYHNWLKLETNVGPEGTH
jgi:hypothetical protein